MGLFQSKRQIVWSRSACSTRLKEAKDSSHKHLCVACPALFPYTYPQNHETPHSTVYEKTSCKLKDTCSFLILLLDLVPVDKIWTSVSQTEGRIPQPLRLGEVILQMLGSISSQPGCKDKLMLVCLQAKPFLRVDSSGN